MKPVAIAVYVRGELTFAHYVPRLDVYRLADGTILDWLVW